MALHLPILAEFTAASSSVRKFLHQRWRFLGSRKESRGVGRPKKHGPDSEEPPRRPKAPWRVAHHCYVRQGPHEAPVTVERVAVPVLHQDLLKSLPQTGVVPVVPLRDIHLLLIYEEGLSAVPPAQALVLDRVIVGLVGIPDALAAVVLVADAGLVELLNSLGCKDGGSVANHTFLDSMDMERHQAVYMYACRALVTPFRRRELGTSSPEQGVKRLGLG